MIIKKYLEVYDNITKMSQIITDSELFKSKGKITGNTRNNGNTKDVDTIVPLKYLGKLWKILEMPLINCKVNPLLHGHQLVLLSILQVKEHLQ